MIIISIIIFNIMIIILKFLFLLSGLKAFEEMKKYMAISLFYFLFIVITIPGLEAKPREAVNIKSFIHMIKM